MRYIRLDEDNRIITVRIGAEIVPGEIESDFGECGDIMQPDGSFITPDPPPITPQPTIAELQENQLILMDAIATLYETILGSGGA